MSTLNQNYDEKVKQAISAWVDGEASLQEKELAERSVRENVGYARYAAELKKLTSSLKRWEAEDLSPDLLWRLQNSNEREGFSMKNLFSSFNVRLAGHRRASSRGHATGTKREGRVASQSTSRADAG